MNDVNKNIRSDEVEQALEILSNEGDDAMFIIPRIAEANEIAKRLLEKELKND